MDRNRPKFVISAKMESVYFQKFRSDRKRFKKVIFLTEIIMSNLFPNPFKDAIANFKSLLGRFQTKQFLSIVFIGFLILTTNTELVPPNNRALSNKLNNEIHQDGESRPKTTEEWSQQAAETDGRPLERIKRVGIQTKEALKDFGEVYPDTFKKGDAKIQNK
jgi:hypothetical protein